MIIQDVLKHATTSISTPFLVSTSKVENQYITACNTILNRQLCYLLIVIYAVFILDVNYDKYESSKEVRRLVRRFTVSTLLCNHCKRKEVNATMHCKNRLVKMTNFLGCNQCQLVI